MKLATRVSVLVGLALGAGSPALAQTPAAADGPPPILRIGREEMRPGKGAAHETNEANWAVAYAKTKMQNGWVGMTSMTGPSEFWYLSGYASWEEMEKANKADDANEAWTAENNKFSALDGEFLSRNSASIASYRPAMSYQAGSNLARFRYMSVQLIRLKPGHGREFVDLWREQVAAHEKAKMDEHWAFYQVSSGLQDGVYIYLQPHVSLAELDQSGPMHNNPTYRDAVGEAGRARAREAAQAAVESSQTLLFALSPKMTVAPQAWIEADPFWAPKPVVAMKPAEKKK
jgi:hypothetical protein